MKNESEKLSFIKALLGIVEAQTDVTHKVPAKVYLNYVSPCFDITDQRIILADLKKKKIVSGYRHDGDDFVISKPCRSRLNDYYFKLKDRPEPKPEKPVDTRLRFDEQTGLISMGTKTCEIPINTNQYFLCKLLFKEKFGTPVTETDIVDMADWAKDTKRSVYDAMRAVNERIEQYLGIKKFIHWKTGRVWIDYKQN